MGLMEKEKKGAYISVHTKAMLYRANRTKREALVRACEANAQHLSRPALIFAVLDWIRLDLDSETRLD